MKDLLVTATKTDSAWEILIPKSVLQFLAAPLGDMYDAVVGFPWAGQYWLAGISPTLINAVRVTDTRPGPEISIPVACFNAGRALWELKFGKEEGLELKTDLSGVIRRLRGWDIDVPPAAFELKAIGKSGDRPLESFHWNSPTEMAMYHPHEWWPRDIMFNGGETHVNKDKLSGAIKALPIGGSFWIGTAKTASLNAVGILTGDADTSAADMAWFSILPVAQPSLDLEVAS